VIKLLGTQPATVRPLTDVKDGIRYLLTQRKQVQREQEFFAAMKAGLDIRINRARLESIAVPASVEPAPPRTPGAQTAYMGSQP
jgi:hypothetical protein